MRSHLAEAFPCRHEGAHLDAKTSAVAIETIEICHGRPFDRVRSEARRNRPLVLLDVDYTRGAFELVLVNCGDEPALDVRVDFSRRLAGVDDAVISDLPLWGRLGLVRSGKEIRVFLNSVANVFRTRSYRKSAATVQWRDGDGRSYEQKYQHYLEAYAHLPEIVHPD